MALEQGAIPAAQERGIAGALDGAEERGDFGITHRGQLRTLERGDGRLVYQTFSGRPDQGTAPPVACTAPTAVACLCSAAASS
ncbi:MAG: hypothetical protein EXR63_01665 [Dehalococcoidia bacterium]|nr:hypothetical protein [Dehalococcoidia bacterium]